MNEPTSSISGEETNYFDRILVDIFISNILSRLPLKSLAQCRCVSKLWSSLIRRPNYNMLFPIKSSAPLRILFTIEYAGELFFYSSPQPQNLDGNNTSLVPTLHRRTYGSSFRVCRPTVGGLICHEHLQKNLSTVMVISNPITGEFLALPKLSMDEIKTKWSNVRVQYSYGYDPIEKQFKILSITSSWNTENFGQYEVLTLGTGNKSLLWRNIQCCTIHSRLGDDTAICISGVLYYPARTFPCLTIACFDVRSENFSFINIDQDMAVKMRSSISFTLIDYKGKLGVFDYDIFNNISELWVLEDAERHKWSKRIFQMPHSWPRESVRAAGMIGSSEIALYTCSSIGPFFILYYNLESNISTTVLLEVPLLRSGSLVFAVTNYVEDLKLM